MQKDNFTLRTGKLKVSGSHNIWHMEWGNNAAAVPIFMVHGGPGSESKESSKTIFDPQKHRAVFFDQRGCGQSTPKFSRKNNTTQDLVEDIEALRRHLGDDKIMLTGGSWGSTLSLLYAIKYPHRVKKLLINGVFLGTKDEFNYMRQGSAESHFPEAWSQYNELVPEARKHQTIKYYYEQFETAEGKRLEDHVRRWILLENATSSIDGDYLKDKLQVDGSGEKNQQMALMEAYYFVNNCFLPDKYILENADKLKHIPMVLVQGRYDHVCPTVNAYTLSEAVGNNCRLHIVPGSHKKEMALRETIRAYAWAFLE
jgi:proline iminopeptidase